MSTRKPADWVADAVESSGRRGGDRLAILRTPGECAAFVELCLELGSGKAVRERLGWDKGRYDSVVKTLKRRGYVLPEMRGKRRPVTRRVKASQELRVSGSGLSVSPAAIATQCSEAAEVAEVRGKDVVMATEAVRGGDTRAGHKAVAVAAVSRHAGDLEGADRVKGRKVRLAAALVASGLNVPRACEAEGVATSTYYQWRRDDPAFRDMVLAAWAEVGDQAMGMAVQLAMGTHEKSERPDGAMVRWLADRTVPEFATKTVKHQHSGVVGHVALGAMSPEEKQAELGKLLRLRGLEEAVEGELAE